MAVTFAIGGPIMWWRVMPRSDTYETPMLDEGQLRALVSYKRKCRGDSDCEQPLSCIRDNRVDFWRCLASECQTDLQCQPGYLCTPLRFSDAPSIRFCLIQGTQKEGEPCEDFHQTEDTGCQPGLICLLGYCARACRLEDPTTCPEGYLCRNSIDGPACHPSCLRKACPPGQECIRIREDLSVCGVVRGQDCDKVPCAQGEICKRVLGHRWREGVVKMWCALPCNEQEGRLCPTGLFCLDSGYCERTCDPNVPGSCPTGRRCSKVNGPAGSVMLCMISEK